MRSKDFEFSEDIYSKESNKYEDSLPSQETDDQYGYNFNSYGDLALRALLRSIAESDKKLLEELHDPETGEIDMREFFERSALKKFLDFLVSDEFDDRK